MKESDSAEGDETESPEQLVRELRGPIPAPPDRAASIDLLEDVFSSLDMEAALQPLGQAKSLEDLRAPKDLREQPGSFDYQVCLWVPRAHEVGPPGHSGVEEIRETPLQHPYSPPTLPHHKQQAHHATSCHGGGGASTAGSVCLPLFSSQSVGCCRAPWIKKDCGLALPV